MKHIFVMIAGLFLAIPMFTNAQSARFEGIVSYSIDLDSTVAEISAKKIVNTHVETTKVLSLQLFLCKENYNGGSMKGIPVCEFQISSGLKSGEALSDINYKTAVTRPGNGNFYPVVVLMEKIAGVEYIIDFISFDVITITKKSTGLLIGRKD